MAGLIVFLKVIALLVTIMIIWFNSGAFPTYCKVLGLKKLLAGYDTTTNGLTFPQYLYIKRDTLFKCPGCQFLIELITCPLCIALWLSIFGACVFLTPLYIPLVYLGTLATYNLFNRLLN
jgi:hypothetical protein